MSGEAWITGATVSAAVLLAGSYSGADLLDRAPSQFSSTVVSVSEDGRTVCLDRAEPACGLRIVSPRQSDRVVAGARVRVTEFWLDGAGGGAVAFHVRLAR